MIDFLTFNSFISPAAWLIMYYVGALLIPLLMLTLWFWINHKTQNIPHQTMLGVWLRFSIRHRFIVLGFLLFAFLLMQIFWRLFIEFILAYFQIHAQLMMSSPPC